jgi:putative restriction endonuclease
MPAVSRKVLIEHFERALRAAGWGVLAIPPFNGNPRIFRLFREAETFNVKLYIWTLTPGGKHRPKDEWRIQPTGIVEFVPAVDGKTVVLGYDPIRDVFVGFDVSKHLGVLGASPSIQTKEDALKRAQSSGFGPYTKATGEVAVAVRPEHLGTYISGLDDLHGTGASSTETELVEQMAADPEAVSPADVDAAALPGHRRTLQVTLRALRDSRFTRRVLAAYQHRCAACGLQLGLLEGAHILPVGHPESTDVVTNGVSLCALHHRAYDRSLIAFDASYTVHVSGEAEAKLVSAGLDGGLAAFKASLHPSLTVPSLASERPDPAMVKKANALRGWLI